MVLSTLLFAGLVFGQGDLVDDDSDEYREAFENELAVDLQGAPRDHIDDGFQKFATCANSGARQHCMAQMKISFGNSCADVSAEIQARANGENGWKDPHNRGNYQVLAAEDTMLKIKRRTGNNKYTDVLTYSLSPLGSSMCEVNSCSVSQGNSNNDAGTNMCNMMNLFCSSNTKNTQNGVACKPVKTSLSYTVPELECGRYQGNGRYLSHNCQKFTQTCLRQESAETSLEIAPVLQGAPRDYRHDGFAKFATCSGSGARQHTMAQMTVTYANSCSDVSTEMQARANGENGWKDPHNRGNYQVLAAEGNVVKMKRRTGNNRYTDVITMALTANGGGCSVNLCSVSQGNSNNDAGTNECNMENLFCASSVKANNGVACKKVKTDLQYNVAYKECGRYRNDGRYRQHTCQNFANTCLRQESAEALEIAVEADEEDLEVVLGAPRDYRHDGFNLFATCSRSGARQHTMAQSTMEFTNSCADVSTEMQARANGENGWKDPHNRGNYQVLAADGNVLKIKRRTGNNRYTDVITMALTANGSGCSANACSVSQGNSNNDAGTNMCNMSNLYCNKNEKNPQNGVACKPVKTDLQYTVSYQECGRYRGDGRYRQHTCQNLAETCLRQQSSLEEGPFHVLKTLFN